MDLKKLMEFVIVLLLFLLGYQLLIIYLEDGHDISYNVAAGDKEFSVKEKYSKDTSEDGYLIEITSSDDRKYIFYIHNSFNKQKKIIKEVKAYEKDDYMCIYPITIKDGVDTEILCNDGKELASYEAVKKEVDLSDFIKELNMSDKYVDDTVTKLNSGDVTIYKNNFYNNEYLELYRYKYMTIYHRNNLKDFSFSVNDIYKNELGVYIKNYFLVPIINKKEITDYYVLNVKDNSYRYITFSERLSNNIYNIGVVDDKLYIFDLNNKEEYMIDPINYTYEVIGNINKGFFMYENGEWVNKSITEFTKDHIVIETDIRDEEMKYDYDHLLESVLSYYLIDGNAIYRVYKKNEDVKVLLFKVDNYNSLTVDDDRIYYLKDNFLYRYDKYGIKKLVSNNEFRYNNTNVYHVYNS